MTVTQFVPEDSPKPAMGTGTYVTPTLERLGTFRQLTHDDGSDFFGDLFRHSHHGCMMTGSSTYTCYHER